MLTKVNRAVQFVNTCHHQLTPALLPKHTHTHTHKHTAVTLPTKIITKHTEVELMQRDRTEWGEQMEWRTAYPSVKAKVTR